jgi:hypothetical protein
MDQFDIFIRGGKTGLAWQASPHNPPFIRGAGYIKAAHWPAEPALLTDQQLCGAGWPAGSFVKEKLKF